MNSPKPSTSSLHRSMDLGPPVDLDLFRQRWYWGDISKDKLAEIMSLAPSGTFAVRDSTMPGHYTLTIRVRGQNKLVKILVENGKCGFTESNLDFHSIVDLIEYYKHVSLSAFNPVLCSSLRFPLERQTKSEKKRQERFEKAESADSLMPDRVVTMLTRCKESGARAHDEYKETAFVIQHFIEQLVAEKERTFSRKIVVEEKLNRVKKEYENLRKGLGGYLLNEAHFLEQKKILEHNKSQTTEKTEKEALQREIDKLMGRFNRILHMKSNVSNQMNNLMQVRQGIEMELRKVQRSHDVWSRRYDRYIGMLIQKGFDENLIERTTNFMYRQIRQESDKTIENYLKVDITTSPFDWLTSCNEKEYAIGMVKQGIECMVARGEECTDGIFLIRPSMTKPGHYAMSISMNNRVVNCLVEFKPHGRDPEFNGYGFFDTQLFHNTLSDFVRYYSVVTLREHNPILDTVLRIPVLRLARPSRYVNRIEMFGRAKAHWDTEPILADYFFVDDSFYDLVDPERVNDGKRKELHVEIKSRKEELDNLMRQSQLDEDGEVKMDVEVVNSPCWVRNGLELSDDSDEAEDEDGMEEESDHEFTEDSELDHSERVGRDDQQKQKTL